VGAKWLSISRANVPPAFTVTSPATRITITRRSRPLAHSQLAASQATITSLVISSRATQHHDRRRLRREQLNETTDREVSGGARQHVELADQVARLVIGHTGKAARRLCPTSLLCNVGSSYSEEPGVEIL